MKIVPAILTNSQQNAEESIRSFKHLTRFLHIDILDDSLIAGKTLPPISLSPLISDFSVAWHLMVSEPEKYFDDCTNENTKAIIIQAEIGEAKLISALSELSERMIPAGIALNPKTSISIIEQHLNNISFLQIMTVEPGAQGKTFIPQALVKIIQVTNYRPRLKIIIDGGINPQTIHQVIPYRPDIIAVGSYLKVGEDLEIKWANFQRIIKV